MKNDREISERWLQDRLIADPALLGLGDLDVKDSERVQTGGGRLDLLLFDPEANSRYEVEIQLGPTDPSHIIRCIEYWDTERRKYPQYEHVAVLIAEDITSRFFNVISLFNSAVPIIAIQARMLEVGDHFTLSFTKVLDVLSLGTEEEDEGSFPVDRLYWEKKTGVGSLPIVDGLMTLVNEVDPDVTLNYNRNYIGLARGGRADNYIAFKPRSTTPIRCVFEIRIPKKPEIDELIDEAGFNQIAYSQRYRQYRLVLYPADLEERSDVIATLIREAHQP